MPAKKTDPPTDPVVDAAIADFEAELKGATGDRAEAIKASIRSLKNPGVTTDAEAADAEGGGPGPSPAG
jgi:hypothetical protein